MKKTIFGLLILCSLFLYSCKEEKSSSSGGAVQSSSSYASANQVAVASPGGDEPDLSLPSKAAAIAEPMMILILGTAIGSLIGFSWLARK